MPELNANAKEPNDELVAEHQFLIQDIQKAQSRATQARALETKSEFANEAYPLLESIVTHFGERFDRIEAVVDELVGGVENVIQEDLAQQIQGTMEIGRLLATAILAAKGSITGRDLAALQAQATAFLTSHEVSLEALEEITVPTPGGDDDDMDEDDANSDGDVTAVEGEAANDDAQAASEEE